jgi:ribosome-binding protein aMBF1 (putative translation factor)
MRKKEAHVAPRGTRAAPHGRRARTIPVEQSFKAWDKDPAFRAAYDALADEFALAAAMIRARAEADMTQDQVAKAMGTTQAVIARLESGRAMPSTRTLERFARATHTRLRIAFEPKMSGGAASRPALGKRRSA